MEMSVDMAEAPLPQGGVAFDGSIGESIMDTEPDPTLTDIFEHGAAIDSFNDPLTSNIDPFTSPIDPLASTTDPLASTTVPTALTTDPLTLTAEPSSSTNPVTDTGIAPSTENANANTEQAHAEATGPSASPAGPNPAIETSGPATDKQSMISLARNRIAEMFIAEANRPAEQQSESLFVPESSSAKNPRKRGRSDNDDSPEEEEGDEDNDGDGMGKVASWNKSKSKKARKNPPKQKKGKGAAKKPKAPRKKNNKQTNANQLNIANLGPTNIFEDTAGHENLPDEPTSTHRRKDRMLQELVDSVPAEFRGQARSDRNMLLAASKDFGPGGSCFPDQNSCWIVKGMKSSLRNYQMAGAAFMRRRETGSVAPYGGICGDSMGLGKTVMMLANIVNGKPPKEAEDRTTLIVATPDLINQWFDEIRRHCDPKVIGRVVKWLNDRDRETNAAESMRSYDIVLTTYGQIRKSYPNADFPLNITTPDEKQKWWNEYFPKNCGTFHKVKFHRIVLDESQFIKNHETQTSRACRSLKGKYRWAMSGTPILNNVNEFFPYFKFLRVPHTGSLKLFRNNYGEDTQRLLVTLASFMIRRTNKDCLFGSPILKLPKASQATVWVDFSPIERTMYEMVRRRMVKCLNRMAGKNQITSSQASVLAMILRLRQICSHILLAHKVFADVLEIEDYEKLELITEDALHPIVVTARGKAIVTLRRELAGNSKAKPSSTQNATASESEPVDLTQADAESSTPQAATAEKVVDLTQDATIRIGDNDMGNAFGKESQYAPYLKELRETKKVKQLLQEAKCKKCFDPPKDPQVTSCFHVYCKRCLNTLFQQAALRDQDKARCLACEVQFENAKPISDQTIWDTHVVNGEPTTADDKENHDATHKYIASSIDVLPSAKAVGVKAQIMNWFQESPDTKIIIYSQFINMLFILEQVCKIEGWGCEKYYGDLSFKARQKVIQKFTVDKKCRILLASLKCGGLGLNLTMASKVISLDPWWNLGVEQQAFCRVYRYGQSEETNLTRFVVKGTIDEQLVLMQARKQKEITAVLDGKRKDNLSERDLLRLFGPIGHDENGRPFIMPDSDDQFYRPDHDGTGA